MAKRLTGFSKMLISIVILAVIVLGVFYAYKNFTDFRLIKLPQESGKCITISASLLPLLDITTEYTVTQASQHNTVICKI